uniref:FAS1 domain-containing protein n=1 Tax=Aegilops tauschii subsp. strangulata TaxID=200361 RepID=A0A453JLN4_AEGTS
LRQDVRRRRRGVPPRALQRRSLRRPRPPRLPAPAHALLLRRPAPPPPRRHRPLRRILRGHRYLRGAHHDTRRHGATPRWGLRLHGAGHARKFAELDKLANLTLFALDDPAIFVGGGHDYVSAVRFHIVPNHRLTRADLHRLRPGTTLPTLAGEGQSLVVTHGSASDDDVRINYTPIKKRSPTWWSTRASPSTASTCRSPASTSLTSPPRSPSRPPPTRRTTPAAPGGPSATAPPQRQPSPLPRGK